MPNSYKKELLSAIEQRCGTLTLLPGSRSLLQTAKGTRIYLRYSKLHARGVAFYGLRNMDLNALDGHHSYICFFSDKGSPLFVPYSDFEAVIRQSPLASDGQFKVQLTFGPPMGDLYLPRVGHFNVDAYGGIDALHAEDDTADALLASRLSHWQVQTLLCGIGVLKGYSVYLPPNNIETLDWTLTKQFQPIGLLPSYFSEKARFASEIDVVWVDHKHAAIAAAFEVEHSTPVYSGLLRFNDVLLTCPGTHRFFVVSNESRRDLFVRQLQRPTFQRSGLTELASFLDYGNVFDWHRRLTANPTRRLSQNE